MEEGPRFRGPSSCVYEWWSVPIRLVEPGTLIEDREGRGRERIGVLPRMVGAEVEGTGRKLSADVCLRAAGIAAVHRGEHGGFSHHHNQLNHVRAAELPMTTANSLAANPMPAGERLAIHAGAFVSAPAPRIGACPPRAR